MAARPARPNAVAGAVRRCPRLVLRRERTELPDGDFLDLDWTTGDHGPIVLILHGLKAPAILTMRAACWRPLSATAGAVW